MNQTNQTDVLHEEDTERFEVPEVETLHTLLSHMSTSPSPTDDSATATASLTAIVESPSPPSETLWIHLPFELRQNILSHFLASIFNDTLHSLADAGTFQSNAATTNPLITNLCSLLSTARIFSTDLLVPLRSVCTDMLRRWRRLLHNAHKRIYEHVVQCIVTGLVADDVESVEQAMRSRPYETNQYYQNVASRVLYSGDGSDGSGILGRFAKGLRGVLRCWWRLEVSLFYLIVRPECCCCYSAQIGKFQKRTSLTLKQEMMVCSRTKVNINRT